MRHFKKSNFKEIQQIKRMYKQGMSANEIGKILHKDHTTIRWWLLHEKIEIRNVKEAWRLKKESKKKEKINPLLCVYCHQPKEDLRWKETKYCSFQCWDKNFRDNFS